MSTPTTTPRNINSYVIHFGMVAIPVKVYVARTSESVSFNMLHEKCGSRVNRPFICRTCDNVEVTTGESIKGYEVSKGTFVTLSENDFKALEVLGKGVEIQEFVPLGAIDPIYFDSANILGPDQGGERAYRLLFQALLDTESAAVGQQITRGREQLVVIRPYRAALAIHSLYYDPELRGLEGIPLGENIHLTDEEMKMARAIINNKSADWSPNHYHDSYKERVEAMIAQKQSGKTISLPPHAKSKPVSDLMAQLRSSLDESQKKAKKRA